MNKRILLILGCLILGSACRSLPKQFLESDQLKSEVQLREPLVIFPVQSIGTTALKPALVAYDFRNQRLTPLVTHKNGINLEDTSWDMDLFVLKDQSESEVIIYSDHKGKVILSRAFENSQRVGLVRISPDKNWLAISWRAKTKKLSDEILIVSLSDDGKIIRHSPPAAEITELYWSLDSGSLYSVTWDKRKHLPVWNETSLDRQQTVSIKEPKAFHQPYFSRETAKCNYDLSYTTEPGEKSSRQVVSIDKLVDGKKSPLVTFRNGLWTHPRGKNFALWTTASCQTALLRVESVLYAIDVNTGDFSKIMDNLGGDATSIPSILRDSQAQFAR